MKIRRKRRSIQPKHLFITFTVLCIILVVVSFKYSDKFSGVKSSVGNVVSPMQNGINSVGSWISGQFDLLGAKKKLLKENEDLKKQVDTLSYRNKILSGENIELVNLRKLQKLSEKYPDYPKMAARVIARDGNNWYNLFVIDKGKEDGIEVDMNVIAGNGLVGIVSEVGAHYAKVRSIIDDKSNVSAMFSATSDTCIVKGNMENMDKGYIDIDMISNNADIKDGDEVVTSHVSEKYLQGLLVGYVTDIKTDPSKLTKTAHLTPAVSFDKLELVLIITKKKDSSETGDILKND